MQTPREGLDVQALKTDILSGETQNIAAALEQIGGRTGWEQMNSADRADLVSTLMKVCSTDAKINDGQWQDIQVVMTDVEPELALDVYEWMLIHPDASIKNRALKMLSQGVVPRGVSPERAVSFVASVRSASNEIGDSLERTWSTGEAH